MISTNSGTTVSTRFYANLSSESDMPLQTTSKNAIQTYTSDKSTITTTRYDGLRTSSNVLAGIVKHSDIYVYLSETLL